MSLVTVTVTKSYATKSATTGVLIRQAHIFVQLLVLIPKEVENSMELLLM